MIKAVIAWYLINLTWATQPLYFLLHSQVQARLNGTNPFLSMRDSLVFLLVGIAFLLVPVVGVFTTLITAPWFVWGKNQDYQTTRDMIAAGRMNWWKGSIREKNDG